MRLIIAAAAAALAFSLAAINAQPSCLHGQDESAAPAGFDVHFATDGTTYAFSIKDTLDPCSFAYFSDEAGVIYTGQALQ